MSPLWIEVDIAKLEEAIDEQNENTTSSQQAVVFDRNLMATVPTGVLIDKKGDVKIVFAKSGLSYDLTAADVAKAMASAISSSRQLLVPSPPFLEFAGANVLLLRWDLPFPPGITMKAEVQFIDASKFTPKGAEPLSKSDQENMGARDGFMTSTRKPRESDWQYAAVRCYELRSIDSFEYDHLRAGKSFYFRIRLWTHEGFTAFSEPSKVMSTLAGPPTQPLPPVVVVSMPTCMQLRWSPPLSNGSKISAYILRGKGAGDTEYRDLYSGALTSHLVMSLHPDSAYSFQVAAVNSIGTSEFSELGSGTTSAVKVRFVGDCHVTSFTGLIVCLPLILPSTIFSLFLALLLRRIVFQCLPRVCRDESRAGVSRGVDGVLGPAVGTVLLFQQHHRDQAAGAPHGVARETGPHAHRRG